MDADGFGGVHIFEGYEGLDNERLREVEVELYLSIYIQYDQRVFFHRQWHAFTTLHPLP